MLKGAELRPAELTTSVVGPGVSADGRRLLFGAGEPQRLWLLDLDTGARTDLVKQPGYALHGAAFSPDARWIALVFNHFGADRGHGFLAPFRGGPLPDATEWIPLGDFTDTSIQWSPDGNVLYSLAERDDFRCIWSLRLHPATKQPWGPPIAIHHFHQSQRSPWVVFSLTVARNKLAVALTESASNIWMTELDLSHH